MAFFLTMPISMMMPTKRIDIQIALEDHQGNQRPETGGRQSGENGDRVDIAFIEYAEHDVDNKDGHGQEEP